MESETKATGITSNDCPEHVIELLEVRLQRPPGDLERVLDAQYELGLNELIPTLERCVGVSGESERVRNLAQRIVRHYLLAYYIGFAIANYAPSYRSAVARSARQQTTEECLLRLGRFEFLRDVMSEHFSAALAGQLHPLLRESLHARRHSFKPRQMLLRSVATIGLANRVETLGHYSDKVLQIIDFGLSGLYLLLQGTGFVRAIEFEVLMQYAQGCIRRGQWTDVRDVVRILATAALPADQSDQLIALLSSLVDGDERLWPEETDTRWRLTSVAEGLGDLASQSYKALTLMREAHLVDLARETLLPMALYSMPALETLSEHLGQGNSSTLSAEDIQLIQRAEQPLAMETALHLISLVRKAGTTYPWAAQMLENAPGLTERTDWGLAGVIANEENTGVLDVLIRLCCQLQCSRHGLPRALVGALKTRVFALLLDADAPIKPACVMFLGLNKGSPLAELLRQLEDVLVETETGTADGRVYVLLESLERWASQMPEPDAYTLAAGWLFCGVNRLTDTPTLLHLVREALNLLELDARAFPGKSRKACAILQRAAVRNHQDVLLVTRVLSSLDDPEPALLLLESLLEIASGTAGCRDGKLFGEALKSVAALSPLTPDAVLTLEKALEVGRQWTAQHSPLVSPAFIDDEVLPQLVHDVSPEAVDTLMEVLWRNHCDSCGDVYSWAPHKKWSPLMTLREKVHRYLHYANDDGYYAAGVMVLCTLQSLANVTDLTSPEQRVIWRLYQTSWSALIKAFALLVLTRQRPLRRRTVRELVRVLRKDPFMAVVKTVIQAGVRSALFGARRLKSPSVADVNYIYLCQGIAVSAIGSLLRQERGDPVVRQYKFALVRALLQVVSFSRSNTEARLASYTTTGTRGWGTRGIARMLGASPEEVANESIGSTGPSWVARPADRAYQLLKELRLEKVLPL